MKNTDKSERGSEDTYTIPKGTLISNLCSSVVSSIIVLISRVGLFPAVIEAGQKVGAADTINQILLRSKNGIVAGVDVVSLYTTTIQKWQIAENLERTITKDGGVQNLTVKQFKSISDLVWPVIDASVKAVNGLKSPDQIQVASAMVFMVLFFGFIIPEITKFILKRDKADIGHKLRIIAMEYIREKFNSKK